MAERGFAAMDPEEHRKIARLGGRAAHAIGKAHEFTTDEARRSGIKGGRVVSQNRAHMSAIGSKGGRASQEKRRLARASTDIRGTAEITCL
ncbi:MAG: KGG domain-containing protein [bacterium]|nr:KGG domain-containing protein [bacterium]